MALGTKLKEPRGRDRVISKSGLTITFRPYHLGGWADGPYSITIPFESLQPYINPQEPLREFL